jgi:hypothetical protein
MLAEKKVKQNWRETYKAKPVSIRYLPVHTTVFLKG